ncbi:DUF6151 family protein [bacterium]|nr:DUF6151 family protein [bacterium]
MFQASRAQVRIDKGSEHLRCLRLSSKGLIRWYTEYCNTPIGNTMNADFPFIGLIHDFLRIKGPPQNTIGPVRAYVQNKHLPGTPAYTHSAKGFPLGITFRVVRKMARGK